MCNTAVMFEDKMICIFKQIFRLGNYALKYESFKSNSYSYFQEQFSLKTRINNF